MLRQARQADLEMVVSHLKNASLVLSGIEEHLEHFWLYLEEDVLIGTIGLEVYGDVALLRSVAVAKEKQHLGIGKKLLQKSLEVARSLGVLQVILLTETAKDYFARFGFCAISREDVPQAVKTSSEFRGACPDSAAVLSLYLPKICPARP